MKRTLLGVALLTVSSLTQAADNLAGVSTNAQSGFTVGALLAGSIVGFEYGRMTTDRIELVGGAGLLGASAGLAYHFNGGIATPAVTAKVTSIGFGYATMFSVDYTYRRPGSQLQWSIGVGRYLSTNDEFERDMEDIFGDLPPVVLTYSIGMFSPR